MIVDIECDIPTREVRQAEFEKLAEDDPGMADYLNIFGAQWALEAGMNREEFDDRHAHMKPMTLRRLIAERSFDSALISLVSERVNTLLRDTHFNWHHNTRNDLSRGLASMPARAKLALRS